MNRNDRALWAPLFCHICSRRAAVIIAGKLLCGECFFKHSVAELSQPDEPVQRVPLTVVSSS